METNRTVAVLGAGGFIGSAIVRNLSSLATDTEVHAMHRSAPSTVAAGVVLHLGDVRDVEAVRMSVRGADAVVHAASYVSYDPSICQEINVVGTANVVAACKAEGVKQLVYMSTASVYGSGPHRGLSEQALLLAPVSVLSQSRADAEQIVLEAGGAVMRPDLVFGAGDRWFVPAVIRLLSVLGGPVEAGSARMSMIHVRDLAAMTADVALTPGAHGAFNAVYPQPNTVMDLVQLLSPIVGDVSKLASLSRHTARLAALAAGFTERQFELLTTDHWFGIGALEAVASRSRLRGFSIEQADLSWYGSHIRALTTT
jgi:nucleoside-diphosphate-sugar epimerase